MLDYDLRFVFVFDGQPHPFKASVWLREELVEKRQGQNGMRLCESMISKLPGPRR